MWAYQRKGGDALRLGSQGVKAGMTCLQVKLRVAISEGYGQFYSTPCLKKRPTSGLL